MSDFNSRRSPGRSNEHCYRYFITLKPPSSDMITEVVSAGSYHSPGWHTDYPKIQILTIADLLKGTKVQMPMQYGTFKQAKRVREAIGEQQELEVLS